MRENDVDAMARTHLEHDDTIYRLWTSGRPIMEILEEERLSKASPLNSSLQR